MAKRTRTYSQTVRHACDLLGAQIREARLERRWSVRELSERAGISTQTLYRVEHGDPTVSVGVAFDLAVLVGVPLFYADRARVSVEAARVRDRIALLPQQVRERSGDLDDDF